MSLVTQQITPRTISFMGKVVRFLRGKLLNIFDATGFCELVGGRAAVEAGLDDLESKALPLVAELLACERNGVRLADAVFDPEQCPHLARLHGALGDALQMQLPSELAPWLERIVALGPALDDPRLHRLLTTISLSSSSSPERALGRLIFFELLCLQTRVEVLAARDKHEVLALERGHVERIAEEEIREAQARPEYRDALVDLDRGTGAIQVIFAATLSRLGAVVEIVGAEIRTMKDSMARAMGLRQRIMETIKYLDPEDGVLIRNAMAPAFGEERLSAEQLRLLHPLLLADLTSEDLARKRLERAKKHLAQPDDKDQVETIADVLIRRLGRASR